ncbi:putative Fe-S oxidoreductase family 2 [Salmonella enterica subsp. enterica]|uniref:Putative Fe-S oxidoreductase family 2 n=1 Tax=Salmonella enterica I TaxID=59201 RepID=A0A379UW67_SALET|nr:putative Fe-S oxidoreductase family 2 [Salmonella enterica subsp. enterica]
MPKGDRQRRLHKALLRYHDPANWPLIRQALEAMGKKHLIWRRRECLVPAPTIEEMREARRQNRNTRPALTKHTPVEHQRQGLLRIRSAERRRALITFESVASGS